MRKWDCYFKLDKLQEFIIVHVSTSLTKPFLMAEHIRAINYTRGTRQESMDPFMYEAALCGCTAHNSENIWVTNWKTEDDWKSIIWVPRHTLVGPFILLCACVYWKDSCLLEATQLCVGLLSCKEVETLLLPSCGQAPAIVSGLMKKW